MKSNQFFTCISLTVIFLTLSGFTSTIPSFRHKAICEEFSADPSADIQKVWIEHNVHEEGRKGMRIHAEFNIGGMQGKECKAVAYFHHENGWALKDHDGEFRTRQGDVSCSRRFTPDYDRSHYSNFNMFMPYGELHVEGTHRLKFRLAIFYGDLRLSNHEEWAFFNLTWRRPSSNSNGKIECGG